MINSPAKLTQEENNCHQNTKFHETFMSTCHRSYEVSIEHCTTQTKLLPLQILNLAEGITGAQGKSTS